MRKATTTTTTATKKTVEDRTPIDRTHEKLIDNSTSFEELIRILRKSPEAVAAEKNEEDVKEQEAREERLREIYGDDYDLMVDGGCTQEIGLGKEKRRPGAAQLRKYEPRVAMMKADSSCTCEVYANGYAVYDNGDRKTVLWVPDCGSITYFFTPLRDNEKEYLKQQDVVGEDVLGPAPWYIAVMLTGENSIERNLVHPKAKGSSSDSDDPADWEGLPDWRFVGGTKFPDPEKYVLEKEAEAERRKALTEKQREAYDLYYGAGYTQEETASKLGLSRVTVKVRLRNTRNIFKKDPDKFFSE